MVNLKNIRRANELLKKAVDLNNDKAIYCIDLGQSFANLGQWEDAIVYYTKAVDLKKKHYDDPEDQNELDYYYSFLSEAYFKAGKLNEFLESFERSGDLNDQIDKKAIVYNRIGNLLADFKKEKDAVQYYEKAIKLDPKRPIYLCNLGLTFTNLRQWQKAIENHKKSVELRKTLSDDIYELDYYYEYLAIAYSKADKLNEFIAFFDRSIDLNDKPDKKAVVYNRIGNLLADSKKALEAIPYYDKAIKLDPKRPIYLCNLGLTYENIKQWQKAIENHKKAVELRKALSEDIYELDYYYEYLAIAYYKADTLNEFIEIFEKSGDLNDKPDKKAVVYNRIGNLLADSKKGYEAIPYYQKAIELDQNKPIYLSNLGLTYANLGLWQETLENRKKAVELRKTLSEDIYELDYYYEYLAIAYSKAGKLNEFIEIFERSGDLNDKPDKKAVVYNRIGNLLADSKKVQEAILYYEKAIELDPTKPIYLCNLGLTYENLGQWQEAIENRKKAVELRKALSEDIYELEYYYEYLAIAYSKADKLNEFIAFFDRSIDLNDKPDKKAVVYNRIGNLLADSKKEQEAILYYEKAIELDPTKPIYLCNLGLTYENLGQWQEAIENHKKAVELRKALSEDIYELDYYNEYLALAYYKAGTLNEFIEIFEKSGDLNDKPDKKAVVYNRIGNLLADSKKEQEAILYYEKAIELDPTKPIYLCNLGLTYENLGQWQEAIENRKKAVELRKALSEDIYELEYYYEYLAIAYSKADKLNEFIAFFDRSIDLNDKPDKKAVVYNRIGNLLADSKKALEAIPYYDKAIKLDPKRPIYLCNLGLTYENIKQWQKAIENHKKAVELRKALSEDIYELDYYYEYLAIAYYKADTLNEFIEIFEKSGDLNDKPDKKAVVYNRIGNLLADSKKEQEAILYYEKAIELDPTKPIYLCNLGLTYENLGQWQEAIENHKKAVELRKALSEDIYELDYYNEYLALAYYKAGTLNEFIEIFEKSGDLNDKPDKKAVVYNRIGNLLADSKKEQEAILYYEKAIELDPTKPIYLCNLGLTNENLGQWQEAIENHKKAVELRKALSEDIYELDYYNSFLMEVYDKINKKDT